MFWKNAEVEILTRQVAELRRDVDRLERSVEDLRRAQVTVRCVGAVGEIMDGKPVRGSRVHDPRR